MFRGNLPYRLLGQNLYPLHRFQLSKSRHRFPRNTLTLISHIITTGSPVLLSDIVTDVATNRIYTGFSPHLHCRTQKRPCQSGRNSEPTKSFSYTYLLRVLPQIHSVHRLKVLPQMRIKALPQEYENYSNSWAERFICFLVHICVFYSSHSSYFAFLCTSPQIFRAKMEPKILLKIYIIKNELTYQKYLAAYLLMTQLF